MMAGAARLGGRSAAARLEAEGPQAPARVVEGVLVPRRKAPRRRGPVAAPVEVLRADPAAWVVAHQLAADPQLLRILPDGSVLVLNYRGQR